METLWEKKSFGDKSVYPLVIPSGIVTTELSTLERLLNVIPELGIATSKSITLNPRPMAKSMPPGPDESYREEIILQYAPGCIINADGWSNPGVVEFKEKARRIVVPEDKVFLVSIAGWTEEEFVQVAKSLEEIADGIEVNVSCPHIENAGAQIGQDSELVYKITKAIVSEVSKPVFVKLSPNVQNIGEIAKAAVDAGAYGITAINTVGPGTHMFDGRYVLSNRFGGLSGKGVLPIGIKCVRDIRQAIGKVPKIIACGGISSADDIRAYAEAGADFFAIGSALAGHKENDLKLYFETLAKDLKNKTNRTKFAREASTDYRKYKVLECEQQARDFYVLTFKDFIIAKPGQFVFLWLPGIGAKPFSVMDNDPFAVAFNVRGSFTKALARAGEEDFVYVRGPYGESPSIAYYGKMGSVNDTVVLVGGGTGIAGLYLFAKKLRNPTKIFLGAKDAEHIPYLKEFKDAGEVFVATEDDSLGHKGLVTELFESHKFSGQPYFINCGPLEMVKKLVERQSKISPLWKIYSATEYMTCCGIGLCGKCANEKGLRTCIEGPFMQGAI